MQDYNRKLLCFAVEWIEKKNFSLFACHINDDDLIVICPRIKIVKIDVYKRQRISWLGAEANEAEVLCMSR